MTDAKSNCYLGYPRGVMVKMQQQQQHGEVVVSKFELYSLYYVHFSDK